MNVRLMYRDRDFEVYPDAANAPWASRSATPSFRRDPPNRVELSRHEQDLVQDLALDTLLSAIAGGDAFLFDVATRALLSSVHDDVDTILHRQQILNDCVRNAAIVRELYALAVNALADRQKIYMSRLFRYPASILHGSIESLHVFARALRELRRLADAHAGRFDSPGLHTFFNKLQTEFTDEYFTEIDTNLATLRFRSGVLMSAELGQGNEGTHYVLRRAPNDTRSWFERLVGSKPPAHTFHVPERDEAGARALSDLRNRGINLVANALAQSTDHIGSFFDALRCELAFYVGCLNLHDRITAIGGPMCFPRPQAAGTRAFRCTGLYDVCLALTMGQRVVPNDVAADGRHLMIITGANQGGKSTFLRSVGLAQLMMQAGLFVAANAFTAEICTGLFTHYKREEDDSMTRGKLDDELSRLSAIADVLTPDSMLLLNESFAATDERDGSEIARQIVAALVERRVKVVFVTHLFEFARRAFQQRMGRALFLRAERRDDGMRTFRVVPGEPLDTSFGADLYREVFADTPDSQ